MKILNSLFYLNLGILFIAIPDPSLELQACARRADIKLRDFLLAERQRSIFQLKSKKVKTRQKVAKIRALLEGKVEVSGLEVPQFIETSVGSTYYLISNHPILGETWCDENDVCWGKNIKTLDGHVQFMSHEEGQAYCNKLGARLPNKAEFIRLRKALGYLDFQHYSSEFIFDEMNLMFWSSSYFSDDQNLYWVFNGASGSLSAYNVLDQNKFAVRCVVQTQWLELAIE